MTTSALISMVAFAAVLLIVAAGIRIGGALARIADLGFGRSLGLAVILLVIELACLAAIALGTSELGEPLAAVAGFGGLIAGVIAPLAVIRLRLGQSWGKTAVVWASQVVAAVLGFAAAGAVTSPGVIGAREKAALARTVSDIKSSGLAVETWIAAQDAAAASSGAVMTRGAADRVDVRTFTAISSTDLRELIGPAGDTPYREHIPAQDGWGHPYQYLLERDADGRVNGVCIRSPGRDGRFEDNLYERGGFSRDDYDRDVVWADGGLLRWPE